MNILTWKELDRKEEVMSVMITAFGPPITLRQTEEIIRLDPRLNGSAVGFCAMENDHVVGFVGVMDLTTRSTEGLVEPVGGIWGVSTLPSHSRKGISTALMNAAHQHFLDKGYRFSFLTTRRTLIAYHLYLKLGYEDVMEFPSAYKDLFGKKAPGRRSGRDVEPDWSKVLDIYSRFTIDRAGFVVRDVDYFRMQKKLASIAFECKERVVVQDKGYVFFGGSGSSLHIDELISSDDDEIDSLIGGIESQAQDAVYDRMILNDKSFKAYRLRGYITHKRSHSLLMAKSLAKDATFKETYSDKFYMTLLDSF